jgi:hypothetical protein
MTTRNPATMSAQAAAAHMSRVKADAEFYDSLDYDRTRYSEDIAVAARIFLIAVRNALRSDPIDLEAMSTVGRAGLPKSEGKAPPSPAAANSAAPAAVAAISPKGGGTADRKDHASNQADANGRGTKRPAPGPPGRNASSQKPKKTKRSPSSSIAGSAAAEAAGNSGGSDGSNGRNSTTVGQVNSNGGGGNTSIPPRSDVACKVKEDGKVSWILAKVSRYVSELKKYEVTDSGDDQRVKKHMVFKKNIRVLPKKPYEFENKQRVLAVYPDTTVFYPATVTGRRGKQIQCLFDDEDDIIYPTKDVDARFVIHPESG